MDEKDIAREAHEIDSELKDKDNKLKSEGGKQRTLGPVKYIILIFLLFIIVLWAIPYYGVKLNPEPGYTPTLEEVLPDKIDIKEDSRRAVSRNQYPNLIDREDAVVKLVADRTVSLSRCPSNSRVCYAKALFYFIRDRFSYVSDPTTFEFVKSARESLYARSGDCDDASVLLANLLQDIGIPTRFVFIRGHVYVQAFLPDALKRYHHDGWVSLDATCQYCDFGSVPYTTAEKEKIYIG